MLQAFYHSDHQYEAGCDEVGRGCLAGPVVAAAVIFPPDFSDEILTDSKALTAKKREALVPVIKENAISWAVAEVSPADIDKMNILRASFHAMHLAIDKLAQKPDFLLIDGNRFVPYPDIPHTCIVKGDSKYLSIAGASVLAKVYRDDLMKKWAEEYPEYGWEQNVGYPTAQHRKAFMELGPTPLHRKSFQLKEQQLRMKMK